MNVLPEIKKVDLHLDAANPFMTFFGYAPEARPVFGGDSHYELQMCIVLVGEHEIMYPDHRMSAKSGQIWWTSCWEPHASRAVSKRIGYFVVSLSVEALGSVAPFQDVDWLAPFFLPPWERPQAESIELRKKVLTIGRALRMLEKKKPYGWKTLQWLKIHELIILMAALRETPNDAANKIRLSDGFIKILPAVQMVKKTPGKSVSLREAAAVSGMSKSRFSEVFTKTMGVTFSRFALRVRMSSAAQMLCATDSSIKDVAFKSGFKDVSHFYHVFDKFFQCTPNEFLNKIIDRCP